MRHPLLVDATADEGIVDVGQRHQAGRQRDGFAGQPLRVAGAIPFLVMTVSNLLGHVQKIDRHAEGLLGVFDGQQAKRRVALHDGKLFRLIAARFEQDPIRNADLADVVQGG